MTRGKIRLIPNFLFILILFAGCATDQTVKTPTNSNLPIETNVIFEEIQVEIEQSEENKMKLAIEEILKKMTIEEKIGQLFLISVRNSYNGERMLHADDYMKNIIETYKPGGIILFTINFATPLQTRDFIRDSQNMSSIPLFIAVDEEGGIVARLGNTDRMSVTKVPPAAVIGQTGNPEYARIASSVISRELRAYGFNMNMAPVADVNTNMQNPVIGNRTYSDDPEKAGEMVAAVVDSMREENMTSVLKHFPGHGDTATDSHKGNVIVEHDRERLETVELIPFKMGIEAGADAVMTAHIQVPALTGDNMPSTMSPLLLQGILRKELGFDGLIITDAMDMGAIKNYWSPGDAALSAFKAGVDIILIPASLSEAFEAISKALDRGEISEERINESVRRILKVKFKRGLFSNDPMHKDDLMDIIGSDEHQKAIESILQ